MEILISSLFLILGFGLAYIVISLNSKKEDNSQQLSEEVKADLAENISNSVQKHLNDASSQFLLLADENLAKHNTKAEANLGQNTQKIEKDVKNLQDKLQVLSTDLTSALSGFKSQGTSLGQHVDNLSSNLQAWNEAMASNRVRGDMGEESLEKILLESGLVLGKNYYKQEQKTAEDKQVKPDVIVELANGGNLVIDSKFPYDDFKKAIREEDPSKQEEHYNNHAQAVLKHVKDLSKKSYFSYLNSSPDYVVLYLNSFIYYYHALRLIPDFIEQARNKNIVIASPEIIIPLLNGVMQQWNEHKVMSEIGEISNEVNTLHVRLKTFMSHMSGVIKEYNQTGDKINSVFKSYKSSVMPSIRKIEKYSRQVDSIEELGEVDTLEDELKEK